MAQMSDEERQFFDLFCDNKYKLNDYYRTYGKDKVDGWLKSDWFISAYSEWQNKLAKDDAVTTSHFNNFKFKSYDVVAKALNGEVVTDHQISTAKWVLSGERAYAESRAKALGERSADQSRKSIGNLILINKDESHVPEDSETG